MCRYIIAFQPETFAVMIRVIKYDTYAANVVANYTVQIEIN